MLNSLIGVGENLRPRAPKPREKIIRIEYTTVDSHRLPWQLHLVTNRETLPWYGFSSFLDLMKFVEALADGFDVPLVIVTEGEDTQ